jgi:hypothetical protein
MKFLSFVLTLVIIVGAGYYIYNNPSIITEDIPNLIEKFTSTKNPELSGFMKDNGGKLISFKDNDIILIKFEYPSLIGMQKAVYDTSIKGYDMYSRPLRVEGYYFDEPVLALETNNPNDENDLFFEDIRDPEFMIESDIGIFDVLVDEVKIVKNDAFIKLEYYGSENDFADDLAGIYFMIIQDVPWLETITINYVKSGMCFTVKTTSENVLQYYNDEISAESYMNNLVIEGCKADGIKEEVVLDGTCSTDQDTSYLQYVKAYNGLTDLMAKGKGDTPEALEADGLYRFYKECYEASIVDGVIIDDSGTDDNEPAIAVGMVCSDNSTQAYADYMAAYNKLTYLMQRGEGDSQQGKLAYPPYKFYKDCWEDFGIEI